MTSIKKAEELSADEVQSYLQSNPTFIEAFVCGPLISRDTFQRWTRKRNNKLRKESRRQLLPLYTTSAGRAQSRRSLFDASQSQHRLLYELALTCAQIAQVDQFELLVRTDGGTTNIENTADCENPDSNWMNILPGEENGTVRLKKPKRGRKPAKYVQKLIDCREMLLAEIHFFSIVNDRDAQYLNALTNWGAATIYFAGLSPGQKAPIFSPSPDEIEYLSRSRKLSAFLLDVLRAIFKDMDTMDRIILKIMNFAQRLVDSDRASMFLVDSKAGELHAQIFDIGNDEESPGASNGEESQWSSKRTEIKFPIGKGIAGYVAQTGRGLNISNAYEDERFNPEVDLKTGYHTRNILCMPIFLRGHVIGVVQMVNKHNGEFTNVDEESFETFAIYCGLALHHAKLYDKIRRSEQKYRVALEVLAYHSVCNSDEVKKLKKVVQKDYIPELDHFEFNPNNLSELEKPLYAVYMFRTLFEQYLKYDSDDLVRFMLTVRKNYRKVSLKSEEYKKVLSIVKHCILATDLALFFPNRTQMLSYIEKNEFDWDNKTHRSLSQAILMTSCDLIATAKPWQIQTETVKVIFEEFYEQGDAEKLNGKEPIPMMDREKASELPQMQVGFMKGICIPCYEVISKVIPEANVLKERSIYNLGKWEELAEEQKQLKEAAEKN